MKLLLVISIGSVLLLYAPAGAQQLSVGDMIPPFKLPYATKDTINFDGFGSDDLKGTRYVLAFYPADWSSGCTKEICTFRDAIAELDQLEVEVLPTSGDYVFSHHEWAKHHNLPFKLLADQTREFGKAMGVYLPERGMFQRSVFVVDSEGRLEYVDYNYSVADDADFAALKAFLKDK